MTADHIILVGNLGREPQAQIEALRANGFRVEQSKAGGYFVSRIVMAEYCRTTSDLATLARRIAADNKALDTLRARAALAGHRVETEVAIDGMRRYVLYAADGLMHFASTVSEAEAGLAAQTGGAG